MVLTVKSYLIVQKRLWITEKPLSLHFPWVHLAKDCWATFSLFLMDVVIPTRGIGSKRGLLQQNLSLEGLFQRVALILWRSDSSTKDSVEKRLIFRNSKRWKLIAREPWNFKEKLGLELCDIASCMRYCDLLLVQVRSYASLQTDYSLDVTVV